MDAIGEAMLRAAGIEVTRQMGSSAVMPGGQERWEELSHYTTLHTSEGVATEWVVDFQQQRALPQLPPAAQVTGGTITLRGGAFNWSVSVEPGIEPIKAGRRGKRSRQPNGNIELHNNDLVDVYLRESREQMVKAHSTFMFVTDIIIHVRFAECTTNWGESPPRVVEKRVDLLLNNSLISRIQVRLCMHS